MSAVRTAGRSIRNGRLDQSTALSQSVLIEKEPLTAPRDEMRGNETVRETAEGGRMKDESGTFSAEDSDFSSFSPHPSAFTVESLIKPLTARQLTAINLLSMGKSVVATAKSLDIGVSTLHRWKSQHPLFRAELAQRQYNLFDAMIAKLRLTMGKAVDLLFELMTTGSNYDRKEVMKEMLKLLKPERFLVPREPASVSELLDEDVRDDRASRGETVSTEITDEERIAAIPAEFRVREDSREHAVNSESSIERATTTPLPSGEGAAADKVSAGAGRAVENRKNDRGSSAGEGAAGNREVNCESIASRPLPQPLPQGEGSRRSPTRDGSVAETSIKDDRTSAAS